jgi:membrane associated rhomboid family serine protease
MLPIGDYNAARRRFPFVNYALIAANVLAFLFELSQPDLQAFIERWGTVPAVVSSGNGLATILTGSFLHAGWAHLLGNMLFLWIFGDNVEDALGHLRYLLFYLASAVAAGLAQVYLDPSSALPGVGASGAISGVLAAYLVMFGGNPVRVLIGFFPAVVPAYLMIGVWILFQFVNGFASLADTAQTGGVAYGAHVGGFVAGLFLTLLLRPPRATRPRRFDPR